MLGQGGKKRNACCPNKWEDEICWLLIEEEEEKPVSERASEGVSVALRGPNIAVLLSGSEPLVVFTTGSRRFASYVTN